METKKYEVTASVIVNGEPKVPGDQVELDAHEAAHLAAAGQVKELSEAEQPSGVEWGEAVAQDAEAKTGE